MSNIHAGAIMSDLIGVLVITSIAVGIWMMWKCDNAFSSGKRENLSAEQMELARRTGQLIESADCLLSNIFNKHDMAPSHGIDHARRVMKHARLAIAHDDTLRHMYIEKLAIVLAALLHDADDRKYFPNNKNYENARSIVQKLCPGIEPLVISMIGYVSTSSNGNSIPAEAIDRPWLLYPRWADRLEAIGWIGIVRAWEYTIETNRPLFTDETPKVQTEHELWDIATKQRYEEYKGKSASMMDHYYDKLLHICNFNSCNRYFQNESSARLEPLIDMCLAFGQGKLTDDLLVNAREQSIVENLISSQQSSQ